MNCRRLLVVVHGASSCAAEMIRHFAPMAREYGIALVAPDFVIPKFRGYQRLIGGEMADGAARSLESVVDRATECLGLDQSKVNLFGFSGGAQFAHRFAMTRPERVGKLIVAAAGWYSECDPMLEFPHGIGGVTTKSKISDFLSLPTIILVGENDVTRNKKLRTGRRIDARQGLHRLARAHFWFNHLRTAANAREMDSNAKFALLKSTGHSFREAVERGGLIELVAEQVNIPDKPQSIHPDPTIAKRHNAEEASSYSGPLENVHE